MGFKLIYVFDELTGGRPDNTLPGVPPGVNVPVFPTHPIAPGGTPPGIWPSPGHPAHPIAPGGTPPGIWPSPGHPSHPIAPGGGGGSVQPPIYYPPEVGMPGFPTPPIYLPPGELPEVPEGKAVLIVYVPGMGYKAIVVDAVRPDQGLPSTEPQPK